MSLFDSDYLENVFSDPIGKKRKIVAKLEAIERLYPEFRFDAIAFRGMSGALMAPMVAADMNKKMIMVRKVVEDSHSVNRVEGYEIARDATYIILDDFVASGATYQHIVRAINWVDPTVRCVGGFEYERFYDYHDSLERVGNTRISNESGDDVYILKLHNLYTRGGRRQDVLRESEVAHTHEEIPF